MSPGRVTNEQTRPDVTSPVLDPLAAATPVTTPAPGRRIPRQARSRQRVKAILDAAARLVLEHGVEALSTRTIADAAGVPVASLYQYFADKEGVLLALLERDMAEMDEQVVADLGSSEPTSVGELVETTMRAFTTVFSRRPAFVEVWLRGRGNAAIRRRGREHNARVAETLREYSAATGLAGQDVPPHVALLAVEVGDRVFQLAYEHDREGDQRLVEEGIAMVTAYLAPYAVEDSAGPQRERSRELPDP